MKVTHFLKKFLVHLKFFNTVGSAYRIHTVWMRYHRAFGSLPTARVGTVLELRRKQHTAKNYGTILRGRHHSIMCFLERIPMCKQNTVRRKKIAACDFARHKHSARFARHGFWERYKSLHMSRSDHFKLCQARSPKVVPHTGCKPIQRSPHTHRH